jgi:UDP-glucose 4-epimerase
VTILVTGGAGFIGRHLVRRLLEGGEAVTVLDDCSTGDPAKLPDDPRLNFIRGCVTDRQAVADALGDNDLVYHLASIVGQVNVCNDPAKALRVSRVSMELLNELAGDRPLVMFSSSAVYGLTGTGAVDEEEADSDRALAYDGGVPGYAYGKIVSEALAAERRADTALVVRPFNVVGPGQVGTYGMVVPRFVEAALAGTPLTIYDDGEQKRSFGDVRAFVGHLLALVAAWRDGRATHGTYNIGTPVETRINGLADAVDRVLETKTERRYVPYDDAYPGKQDVLARRPGLERLHSVLGELDWPSLDVSIASVADSMRGAAEREPAEADRRLAG